MKQQSPSLRVDEAPTFFGEFIDSLSERGWALLGRRSARSAIAHVDLAALSELLLSRRGEASGVALAQALLASYAAASAAERLVFLRDLAERFGPDRSSVDLAIEAFRNADRSDAIIDLHRATEPRRQELFRRLNLAPGGTAALVRMRDDVLENIRDNGE